MLAILTGTERSLLAATQEILAELLCVVAEQAAGRADTAHMLASVLCRDLVAIPHHVVRQTALMLVVLCPGSWGCESASEGLSAGDSSNDSWRSDVAAAKTAALASITCLDLQCQAVLSGKGDDLLDETAVRNSSRVLLVTLRAVGIVRKVAATRPTAGVDLEVLNLLPAATGVLTRAAGMSLVDLRPKTGHAAVVGLVAAAHQAACSPIPANRQGQQAPPVPEQVSGGLLTTTVAMTHFVGWCFPALPK
jgi:hypothetical protein